MKILVCYGTRPEWIKIKPLLSSFDKNDISYKVLFTGQHDSKISNDFKYDYIIDMVENNNRLNSIISSMLSNTINDILKDFTHVMVHGDTSSALACAISAMNNKVKVIHLEAGLRSFDNQNPWPEEYNRCLIGKIADIHFCPTKNNQDNLRKENIKLNTYIVGNTIFDSIVHLKYDTSYQDKVLITLHRRENMDSMDKWFSAINEIALKYSNIKFIFPMHPNPNIHKFKYILNAENISIIEPLEYYDMITLLKDVKLVITDSGGIQEECSFFNKICLVCRKTTERPESLYMSTYLINNHIELIEKFDYYIPAYNINYTCQFGDGYTCDRICEILKDIKDV